MLPGNVIASNENSENSETTINNPEPSPSSTLESIGCNHILIIYKLKINDNGKFRF